VVDSRRQRAVANGAVAMRTRTVIAIRLIIWLSVPMLLASGCMLLTAREQQRQMGRVAHLWGTVRTEHESTNPLVVVLLRHDGQDVALFDHFVLERPGRWHFPVEPGIWHLAAFEDVSGDLVYELDEPALPYDENTTFVLHEGEERRDIDLVIPTDGRACVTEAVDIREMQARTVEDQMQASMGQLTVLGEIVDFQDPRFARENGSKGMWAPLDLLFDVGPGIYFLEPYDPEKIPVLFVHGITGTPLDFEYLVGELDRSRFQPWLVYYPTGVHLDRAADYLSQLTAQLWVQHRFNKLFVVAHSMGGLVSRSFIQKHHEQTGKEYIKRFVTISTPWGGQADAGKGVRHSPVAVYSWIDIAPGSDFLEGMFYEDPGTRKFPHRLPDHATYDLIFGYQRQEGLPGASSDKVITVASHLRLEAQQEAASVYGLNYDHTGILRSPEASARLNVLLTATD
jgi:pimeloyl-ACP methyl ester carboxylesterase